MLDENTVATSSNVSAIVDSISGSIDSTTSRSEFDSRMKSLQRVLENSLKALEDQVQQLESEKTAIQTHVKTIAAELKQSKQAKTRIEEDNQALQEDLTQLKAKFDELKAADSPAVREMKVKIKQQLEVLRGYTYERTAFTEKLKAKLDECLVLMNQKPIELDRIKAQTDFEKELNDKLAQSIHLLFKVIDKCKPKQKHQS